jgi:hypothetical protein
MSPTDRTELEAEVAVTLPRSFFRRICRCPAAGAGALLLGLMFSSLEAAMPPEGLSAHGARMVGQGVAFRGLSCLDFPAASARFGATEHMRPLLDSSLQRAVGDVWSQFMSGTFLIAGHLQSERPVLAFYNPFFDAALLTEWGTNGAAVEIRSVWVAVDLSVSDENRVNGGARSTLLDPWDARTRMERSVRWFERAFPPTGSTLPSLPTGGQAGWKPALEVVLARLTAAQLELAEYEALGKNGLASPNDGFERALRQSDRSALAALLTERMTVSTDTLLKIPKEIRSGIEARFTLLREKRLLVFSWNSFAPDRVVFTDYARDAGWRLTNAALLEVKP